MTRDVDISGIDHPSFDDQDIGFLGQFELAGVDTHLVDQIARDEEISAIHVEVEIDAVDNATTGLIEALPRRSRRAGGPPTTSTPNRPPGQAERPANTTHSPRGRGRARVDPATSMRQANIMDIFPVRIAGCQCEPLNREDAEWLNPAQNTHGQSVKVTSRVMPEIEKFFLYVAGRGDFPYKTMEDVVRHAINRHCEWLNRQEPMPDHFLVAVRQINTLMRDEMMRVEIEENLPGLINVAVGLVRKGFLSQANGIMTQVKSAIAVVADPEHRHQLETTYQKLIGSLIEEVKIRFPQTVKQLQGADDDE